MEDSTPSINGIAHGKRLGAGGAVPSDVAALPGDGHAHQQAGLLLLHWWPHRRRHCSGKRRRREALGPPIPGSTRSQLRAIEFELPTGAQRPTADLRPIRQGARKRSLATERRPLHRDDGTERQHTANEQRLSDRTSDNARGQDGEHRELSATGRRQSSTRVNSLLHADDRAAQRRGDPTGVLQILCSGGAYQLMASPGLLLKSDSRWLTVLMGSSVQRRGWRSLVHCASRHANTETIVHRARDPAALLCLG